MIFTSCLETRVFSLHWKKANVVPIHKTKSKQVVKNYRPVSLLPFCGKIFERLMYNEVYPYFTDNNLITSHQSGFKGGDSCINQLLSITHEIYNFFDEGFEVRGVFKISPRHLIECRMAVLYSSLKKTAFMVNYCRF